MTETEILAQALERRGELTGSADRLRVPGPARGRASSSSPPPGAATPRPPRPRAAARWRGAPPADDGAAECLATQQPVVRDAVEGTGVLRQAGLPGTLRRQLCAPLLDGGRVAGRPAARGQGRSPTTTTTGGTPAQVAEALCAGAAPPPLRRRSRERDGPHGARHARRRRVAGGLAESQDAGKTGRARRVAELAAGIGTALGLPGHTRARAARDGPADRRGHAADPARDPLAAGPARGRRSTNWSRRTPSAATRACAAIEFPWPVAEVVRQHHERLDGSGYPRGLKGEEILLEARIVAVADAAEAMLAPRPQRAAAVRSAPASRSFNPRPVAGTMPGSSRPASSCCANANHEPKARRPSASGSPEASPMQLEFYGGGR